VEGDIWTTDIENWMKETLQISEVKKSSRKDI
jgi:hypothetical protein